jgi:hypothetical protein
LAISVCVLLAVSAASTLAADLRITDSRGTELVVSNAAIDYSSFLATEVQADGIRVLQGDGTVTVKWADVDSVKVVRQDDSVKPPRIELEIVLRNGRKVPAALIRLGRMKLTGKTELGDYSIDLDKVRSIVPVR